MKPLCLALLLSAFAFAAPPDCSKLEEIRLPDTKFTKITPYAAGQQDSAPVAHCEAEGVIGDEIGFVVELPAKEQWNGKFLMAGVGGFAGAYNPRSLDSAVGKGYAAATTDTGHRAPGIRADWAHNHAERLVNYGYLAVHRTAETAKAIIREFYGDGARYSYFTGCSNGGRQAMMEAQRYPDDFDGIVAGAPAYNFTGIMAEFVYNMQRIFPDPEDVRHPLITPDNRKLLQASILEQCDRDDGAEDGILGDPRTCNFKLSDLPLCPGGEPAPHCLTVAQREAIAAVYDGPRNQQGRIFPGFPFGGEAVPGGWDAWITGPNSDLLASYNEPSAQFGFGTQGFKYLVFDDPDWDYSSYDFADFANETESLGAVANAVDTDLSGLKASGGKLILWHGWADPALTVLASVDYYESASARDPETRDYFRFYTLPGVLHCAGGPGADRVDWLSPLESWVERDQAPGTLTASRVRDGKTTLTRPVCLYPEGAVYRGAGDVNDAASFECRPPR